MKIYRGHPGPPESTVTVHEGGTTRPLYRPAVGDLGYGWGDGGMLATRLALALAGDVLDDDHEATKIYQRLKHRTVRLWPADQPWMITEADLKAQIEDIRKVERETAQMRAMVAREPAPVVNEGGLGIGGKTP